MQRINKGVIILLSIGGLISSVAMSFLFASICNKMAVYNVLQILVIMLSVIAVMFSVQSIANNAPWYSFLVPSISYAVLVIGTSYYGPTV